MLARKIIQENGGVKINSKIVNGLSKIFPNISQNTLVYKINKHGTVKELSFTKENKTIVIQPEWTIIRVRAASLTKKYTLYYNDDSDVLFWWERYFL